ncbi:hypothetical protein Pfl01_2430 [Pseudomonas fluorescens Pf0-1]|uniref:Uncharacterized protein n=1 Tax=Pseudomonas fluorescens (strain Pf0-1) TaxID=205922 RepID=Q3KDI4_PSEPF|nr:hypothetical protein Pfl01_2430 [Pseudomonas fluorescens Pf0-1]
MADLFSENKSATIYNRCFFTCARKVNRHASPRFLFLQLIVRSVFIHAKEASWKGRRYVRHRSSIYHFAEGHICNYHQSSTFRYF